MGTSCLNKMSKITKIQVVCFANYCRSPVAEKLLQSLTSENINVTSAGISPMVTSTMDKRSKKFLEDEGYNAELFVPQEITSTMIMESKLTLALDFKVFKTLIDNYGRRQSIKMFNFLEPSTLIPDPYNCNSEDYLLVMKDIKRLCMMVSEYINNNLEELD